MVGQLPGFRVALRESILGYIFWNLFWQLCPAVWLYPLNQMGVTGYEVAALVWFSPLLLGIPVVGALLKTTPVLVLLRLITISCILAHHSNTLLQKLLISCLGNGTLLISTTISLWSLSVNVRRATFWGLILGLFLTISTRIWTWTFIPAWYNTESNLVSFAIGLFATIDKIYSGDDWFLDKLMVPQSVKTNWFSASAGLASLLYLHFWVFSEVSVLTRWVLSTYPTPGPQPLPFGMPVLLCLAVGFILGFKYNIATSLLWYFVGLLSFIAVFSLESWIGYICGLVLAVYSSSLLIFMFDAFVSNGQSPPIRSMTVFSLVFFLEMLFCIFAVAYNFVYDFGGAYARERFDVLICVVMFLIGLGIFRNKNLVKHSHGKGSIRESGVYVRAFFILFILFGCAGVGYRMAIFEHRKPAQSRPDTIRTAVWTCHFGFDNSGWPNALRAIDFLNKTDADVIAVIESDTSKPFLGNNDLTAIMGEKLGMYTDFGTKESDHCWGANLMSRYPILYSEHHMLSSPNGELAPAILARLDVGEGRVVDVVVTHMGIEEDDLDRRLQAKELSTIMDTSADSTIFLGYITCAPGGRDYVELTKNGRMHDIDREDNHRWCEYILYRGLERLGYARVTHAQLSDTELQMATFKLPQPGASLEQIATLHEKNPTTVTDENKVDPSIRFPKEFGGFASGHRSFLFDHVYHMSTPKYFV